LTVECVGEKLNLTVSQLETERIKGDEFELQVGKLNVGSSLLLIQDVIRCVQFIPGLIVHSFSVAHPHKQTFANYNNLI
jgi:hypothetical protein